MKEIDKHFFKAIDEKVFPSASLLVFRSDEVLYSAIYGRFTYDSDVLVSEDSLYDIASLTKPLVTSLSIAYLFQSNELKLDNEMGHYFSEYKRPEKLGITIRDLLSHRSGLPSYKEYFKCIPEERWGSQIARDEIFRYALNEGIEDRGRTVYSDIDFIILGYLIEVISSVSLRDFFKDYITKHLNLSDSDFCGNFGFRKEKKMVPVSNGFIGVDDENARALGGISGHSGLFSNCKDIHKILCEVFNSYNDLDYKLFKPPTIRELLKKSNDFINGMFRGGFDTPIEVGSQYGDYFKGDVIAHLGFTGTSFVMDLKSGFGIILLTNRVCPDRTNFKIKEFRRYIHNILSEIFLLGRREV